MTLATQNLQEGLTFDAENHAYAYEGRPLVSVTQAIGGLIDSAWFTEDARWWGQCVHKAIELIESDLLRVEDVDPLLQHQCMEWLRFKSETGYSTLQPEMKLAHDNYKYAGMIDNLGVLHDGPAVIDLKSSAGKHRWWACQIHGGYEGLIRANHKALGFTAGDLKFLKSYVLQLPREGNYKLIKSADLWPDAEAKDLFHSCLKISHFRSR